jgi:hypothetical protein
MGLVCAKPGLDGTSREATLTPRHNMPDVLAALGLRCQRDYPSILAMFFPPPAASSSENRSS